jgi:hypothetical protein
VNRAELVAALDGAFDAGEDVLRAVSRQARDLADAGRIAEDLGFELTVEAVVSNLQDAPDGYTLAERWNWWIGSLELSHRGYRQFRVRPEIGS